MSYKENVFFVANRYNHTILKITSSGMSIHHSSIIMIVMTHCQGTVSVFAGSGEPKSDDGVGRKASFGFPYGLAIDQDSGTLFVTGLDHKIRKITRGGEFASYLSQHNTC